MLEYPDDVFRPLLELVLTGRIPLSLFSSPVDPHVIRSLIAEGRLKEEGSWDDLIANAERFLDEEEPPEVYFTRYVSQEVSLDGSKRIHGHPVHARLSRNMDRTAPGPLENMLGRVHGIDPRKIMQNFPGLHR